MATQTTIPPPILSATSPADIASTCETFALSREEFDNLHRSAKEAKSHSYSPYSKFRVGAALLTQTSLIITGANVENASYPVTTCAERTALCKAVTTVHPPNSISWASKTLKFKAIAVATDISPPASPCGMCRQAIREFCSVEIPIIMFDGENGYAVLRLKELLPLSFGPEALGKEDLGRRGDS
uniref:Cytidine deaminase n=1 Tax=Podospora anserina (strain S / ATCC MYA-4624 / DSM 980 / FGSC 10383) TaxID=515849 RepID=A0A090C9C9_PODAN|nr:Putative cytidine deaminase [Podospora anserina S mat+]